MHTHEALRKYYDRKRDTSPAFSLRSLARRVQVSPSFLSRILSGQKPVPYPLLLRLGPALDIEPEIFTTIRQAHQVEVDDSAGFSPRKGKAELDSSVSEWNLTSPETLRVLRQWFYLPILEFSITKHYDGIPETVAAYLGLTVPTVVKAMEELKDLKLLVPKDGVLVKTSRKLRMGSGKPHADIRRFHDAMLERARRELAVATATQDFERRLITGITVTASPEKIAAAKQRLAECLHEIANELAQEKGTEVYHLSAQLFPLTKKP